MQTKLKQQVISENLLNNSMARQVIINGNFVVNQRGYVSNATLSSGTYGHDRWKAGTSGGDYTFTQYYILSIGLLQQNYKYAY